MTADDEQENTSRVANWIRHLFGRCGYKPVAVDVRSAGPLLAVPASTVILWRCDCGWVKSTIIVGRWSLEQIRGGAAGEGAPDA